MKEKIKDTLYSILGGLLVIAFIIGWNLLGSWIENSKPNEPKFYELAFVFPGENIYHCFDCIKIHESDGEEIEMTISEAKKKGLNPCPDCHPDETSVSYAREDEGDYVPQFPYR